MKKQLFLLAIILIVFYSQTALAQECVDMQALMSYIGQWKTGTLSGGMTTLMQKISDWKSGANCGTNTINLGDLKVPSNRIPDFTKAGVEGGLPNTSDTAKWETYTTLSQGATLAQIQTAINNAAAQAISTGKGQIVRLSAGSYSLGSSGCIMMKSNVVLKGAGMNNTTIVGEKGCMYAYNYNRYDWDIGPPTHKAGAAFGMIHFPGNVEYYKNPTTMLRESRDVLGPNPLNASVKTLQLNNVNGLSVGDFVWIFGRNSYDFGSEVAKKIFEDHYLPSDPANTFYYSSYFPTPLPYGNLDMPYQPNANPAQHLYSDPSRIEPAVSQIARITAISGNSITLDKPLGNEFTPGLLKGGIELRKIFQIENSGLEDLTITGSSATPCTGDSGPPITETFAINTWVNRVKAELGYNNIVSFSFSARNSLVNSVIGMMKWNYCNTQCNPVPSNCTGVNYRYNAYAISTETSSFDNLISNNAIVNSIIQYINARGARGNVFSHNYITTEKRDGPGIFFHSRYSLNNLVESNDTDHSITAGDSYWRRNGPNIFYRNRIRESSPSGIIRTIPDRAPTVPSIIGATLIGNTTYYFSIDGGGSFDAYSQNLWLEDNIGRNKFSLTPNPTTDCGTGTGSSACPGTNKAGIQKAPAEWSSLNVPASLAFASKSDWEKATGAVWCSQACPWEAQNGIGAFGDDFSTGAVRCKLPAEIWDSSGTCT